MENKNKINLLGYERDILIYTFRYCLSSRSYAVATMIELLVKNWYNLSLFDRELYQKEIREYFQLSSDSERDKSYWQIILDLPLCLESKLTIRSNYSSNYLCKYNKGEN